MFSTTVPTVNISSAPARFQGALSTGTIRFPNQVPDAFIKSNPVQSPRVLFGKDSPQDIEAMRAFIAQIRNLNWEIDQMDKHETRGQSYDTRHMSSTTYTARFTLDGETYEIKARDHGKSIKVQSTATFTDGYKPIYETHKKGWFGWEQVKVGKQPIERPKKILYMAHDRISFIDHLDDGQVLAHVGSNNGGRLGQGNKPGPADRGKPLFEEVKNERDVLWDRLFGPASLISRRFGIY